MILECPNCNGRYLISASLFTAGPRQVRCARCAHSWQAELPKELDAVGRSPDADLTLPPDSLPPIPPGSGLPVVQDQRGEFTMGRTLFISIIIAFVALILLGLVAGRHWVAERWPGTEGFYDLAGLHIYHYGEGLSFLDVRSDLRYDSGIMRLAVDGRIHNATPNVQEIPNIQADAMGADDKPLRSWQIDAPATKVFPGEEIPFHSLVDAPQGTVAEIKLSFIETKHDGE